MNRQHAAVLKAYLCDGWSHRQIQERILGIDAPERGGGYEAMRILHGYGVTGEYKSSLYGRTFNPEAFESSGNIRNYCETILKQFGGGYKMANKARVDGQLTALAGEFFVAAELLRRGLQTSVTFGNAKAIDLLAHNPIVNCTFKVQVKALRKMNWFLISPAAIKEDNIYVFVLLNNPGEAVRYFIVPGAVLQNEAQQFGKDFQHPTMPGIHPKQLGSFEDAWHYFDQPVTLCA